MELFNTLFFWSSLYLGIIPGHQLSMYKIPEHQEWLVINQTYLADFKFNVTIKKYIEIYGGVTTFTFKTGNGLDFYPFRSDYQSGISLKYSFIKLSYDYGCYHPLTPLCDKSPLPKLDASQQRIGIEFQIGKKYN